MEILHYLINKTRHHIQIENPKTSMHGSHQGLISNLINVNDLIYNQTYLNTSKLINYQPDWRELKRQVSLPVACQVEAGHMTHGCLPAVLLMTHPPPYLHLDLPSLITFHSSINNRGKVGK